jgi:hypothetical protein
MVDGHINAPRACPPAGPQPDKAPHDRPAVNYILRMASAIVLKGSVVQFVSGAVNCWLRPMLLPQRKKRHLVTKVTETQAALALGKDIGNGNGRSTRLGPRSGAAVPNAHFEPCAVRLPRLCTQLMGLPRS